MTFRLRSKRYLKLVGGKVPTKYHSEGQSFQGIHYHSKKEANYAGELEWRVKAGDIKGWERQVKIEMYVKGYHVADYKVDFRVTHNDGTVEYVEVKGFETPEWRIKWKLFEALYSDIPGVLLTVQK